MSLLDQLDSNIRPFAQQLFDIAKTAGVSPRITSGVRTFAQQKTLYEAYISGRSRYPAAPPGSSAHEYGLAFDMVVDGAVNQSDCGVVWSSWGGVYGGEEDPIHFEHPLFRYLPRKATPSVQQVPVYTPSTLEVKSRQLSDLVLPGLMQELGYTVSIDAVAHAIALVVGQENPLVEQAVAELDWGLAHPSEFLGYYMDAMRSVLLSH